MNNAFLTIDSQYQEAADIQSLSLSIKDVLFSTDTLFLRIAIVNGLKRNDTVVLDAEGDEVDIVNSTVDVTFVNRGGKVRAIVNKTTVTDDDILVETMRLTKPLSELEELIVAVVNITNACAPAEREYVSIS